jgi:hypothetical protein
MDLVNDAAKSRGRAGTRLIWILDEFQRIDQCNAKSKEEINTGLRRRSTLVPMV